MLRDTDPSQCLHHHKHKQHHQIYPSQSEWHGARLVPNSKFFKVKYLSILFSYFMEALLFLVPLYWLCTVNVFGVNVMLSHCLMQTWCKQQKANILSNHGVLGHQQAQCLCCPLCQMGSCKKLTYWHMIFVTNCFCEDGSSGQVLILVKFPPHATSQDMHNQEYQIRLLL